MSEIEKKYSDFQQGECKEEEVINVVDEKICPTCEPDPDFKLPKQWFEIPEAYLNKKTCEYHVRVYESEVNTELDSRSLMGNSFDEVLLEIAALKILRDLDKPINTGTRTQVTNACAVIDTYYGTRSALLGKAYLVATPAFNIDQVASNDDPDAEENDEKDVSSGGEFILQGKELFKKLTILRLTLNTYSQYYSMAQHVDDSFVIRQEDDIVQRINYRNTSQKLKDFMSDLSDALSRADYPRLGYPDIFSPKRVDRIKFVFKSDGNPFELKGVYVLPDVGCREKYERIPLTVIDPLKNLDYAVIYNFLKNLDKVWNDLTAKETMPWLEWTLEHFYPQYIVDRGSIEDLASARNGLECLLEDQLGLDPGKIVDSLSREIMSAFDSIEKEYNKQACREIERLQSGGPTTKKKKDSEVTTAAEEARRDKMLKRYTDEYINKFYSFGLEQLEEVWEGILMSIGPSTPQYPTVVIKKESLFTNMKELGLAAIDFVTPSYKYKADGKRQPGGGDIESIKNEQELKSAAAAWATNKFNRLEDGSFGDSIQNSPHFHETKEAIKEVYEKDNLALDLFRGTKDDPENEFSLMDLIPIVGVCGLSKMAAKALSCLTNGITFDAFLDILISKTFEFMKINTLDLFFNDIPADVRRSIDEKIAEEFGPNVDLSALLGIKMATGGGESLKDFLTIKNHAKRVKALFEKYEDPLAEATKEEVDYIKSQIGDNPDKFLQIGVEVEAVYNREEKIYVDYEIVRTIDGEQKTYKRADKYITHFVKKKQREHKKTQESFTQAVSRISDSLVITPGEEDREEELNRFEKSSKSLETTALGVKVDAVFDLVFDYAIDAVIEEFAIDDMFALLRSYPAVDFILDKIGALVPSCPNSPIIYPPPNGFLKTLSIDVCDPNIDLALPVLNIPSINWRFAIQGQLSDIIREALFKLVGDIMVSLVTRLLSTLEGALCNAIEAAGGLAASAIAGEIQSLDGLESKFYDALDEAFCNDGESPETSRKRAEELADALFAPVMFQPGSSPQGGGKKVAGIIGSVSSTNEILGALVSREGETNDQFNERTANAINILAPEMRSLLGSPNQVAYFFRNLGSHLSPDDRERIRDILDADIPNLPTSAAICLTDEELENWNDLRNQLLQDPYGDGSGRGGLTPEQAAERVADLNRRAEDAVEDIIDDLAGLDSGDMLDKALEKEMNKDACNPNNLLSEGIQDSVSSALADQATDAFYSNVERSLTMGFTGNNGILGEALADFKGNKEFARSFLKLFNPNYGNAQSERDNKYDSFGFAGQFVMDVLAEGEEGEGLVAGQYPKTVAITQREQVFSDEYKSYNFTPSGNNIVFEFFDTTEGKKIFGIEAEPQTYSKKIIATNILDKNSFDYNLKVTEKINDQERIEEISVLTPVSITEEKTEYMRSIGFDYTSNDEADIRAAFFNQFARRSIPLGSKDYSDIYKDTFKSLNKQVVEMLLTNPAPDPSGDMVTMGLTPGYIFGYVNETLTTDDFIYYNDKFRMQKYNKDEEDKQLGVYGSDRIVALDPSLYGGRYSNPPFYVEPRQFSGWMELGTKAFDSPSGCDPKQPPLISFHDIKDRTKTLARSLRNDPRLSEDPDCVKDIPFKALLDKNTQAHMDGIVRTTIRSYAAEYFMKGYGLFSNLEMNAENFDNGMFSYITKKMKEEMYDLGWSFSSTRISITKEKYWYTFLEQCVEAYQRKIDVDGFTPPEKVMIALNEIQKGIDAYVSATPQIKKQMRIRLGNQNDIIDKPPADFDPLEVVRAGPVSMGLQAVAFRLTTDLEEKADFFNGGQFDEYSSFAMRFASIKKIKFFQKQYFIALYEKQATLIMSELIREEFNRLIDIVVDGLSDKPYYSDLSKSIFSIMPGSTSVVGSSPFYIDKQTNGEGKPGSIPEVKSNNSSAPIAPTDEPQLIVESYARIVDKNDPNLPAPIRNRAQKYVGVVSLSDLSAFVDQNLNVLEDSYISDFFGNLSFLYKGSLKSLMEKGFTDDSWMSRLHELNEGSLLFHFKDIRDRFLSSREFQDIEVKYDEAFLLEGEDPQPVDVVGTTGIKYGIRLSIVFPDGFLSASDMVQIMANPDFVNMSKNEKSYIFDDNSFVLPLVSEEIDVKDAKFEQFDPLDPMSTEPYDLECMINKITKTADFKLFMENIFNIKQTSSMLGIYCMETFMPSLGQKTAPEESSDSDNYEREDGRDSNDQQDWDGTINWFAKEMLRRQFKSLYLSRTIDGTFPDLGDWGGPPKLSNMFQLGNPLDYLVFPAVRIPWWTRRRMKTKIYDANGMECADPKKDLT